MMTNQINIHIESEVLLSLCERQTSFAGGCRHFLYNRQTEAARPLCPFWKLELSLLLFSFPCDCTWRP